LSKGSSGLQINIFEIVEMLMPTLGINQTLLLMNSLN
jgi:hypothetical protein